MPPKPPPSPKRSTQKQNTVKQAGVVAAKHATLSNPRPHPEHDPNAPDLIAFAAVEFICFEFDPTITVKLVRRGEGKGEITLTWKTENGNVSAESYQLQEGAITGGQMEASLDLSSRQPRVVDREHDAR